MSCAVFLTTWLGPGSMVACVVPTYGPPAPFTHEYAVLAFTTEPGNCRSSRVSSSPTVKFAAILFSLGQCAISELFTNVKNYFAIVFNCLPF